MSRYATSQPSERVTREPAAPRRRSEDRIPSIIMDKHIADLNKEFERLDPRFKDGWSQGFTRGLIIGLLSGALGIALLGVVVFGRVIVG